MSEKYCCDICDKELSEEKLETLHGCLDCHGTPWSDKIFWLKKDKKELEQKLAIANKIIKKCYLSMKSLRESGDSGFYDEGADESAARKYIEQLSE